MIAAPLSLIASTLLLGDAERLAALMQELIADPAERILQKYAKQALFQQTQHLPGLIEARFPRQYRPNEAEFARQKVKVDEGLDWLADLFDEYFQIAGDQISPRRHQTIKFMHLVAQIHPALPVAWKVSDLVHSSNTGQLSLNDVRRVLEASSSNFLARVNPNQVTADLHVHLGGANETSASLLTLALQQLNLRDTHNLPSNDYERNTLKQYQQWQASYQTLFNLLLRRLMGEALVPSDYWHSQRNLLQLAWETGHCSEPALSPKAWIQLRTPNVSAILPSLAYLSIKHLAAKQFQIAWLYWLTALCLLFRETTALADKTAIVAFLHLAQLFRRDMIHAGVGLSRFVRYSSSTLRKASTDEDRDYDALRQLIGHPQQRAEFKLTPWIAEPRAAKKFIGTAADLLHSGERTTPEHLFEILQRMQVCIHFVRKPAQSSENLRYAQHRRATAHEAHAIDDFMCSATAACYPLTDAVTLDLRQFIRGLDVAGDEVATPIEVYAPALRWLRRSPRSCQGLQKSQAMHGLHLSIHAGEDFNHILSGMRHIDETVLFCNMTHNDRLGHALAIGIPPWDWFNRVQEVFVPVAEHLDNLVWAWRKAQRLAGIWLHADAIALRLSARIRIYAPMVYGEGYAHLTPENLYEAWLLRQNCPLKWQQYELHQTKYSTLKYWVPDADAAYAAEYTPAKTLYKSYQSWYQQIPGKKPAKVKSDAIVIIRAGEQLPTRDKPIEDFIAPIELDFIEAVQDHLLDIYANKKGLIIEANPSSNVFINRIPDYQYHPIFRWHPPNEALVAPGERYNRFGLRKGIMPVCVNTDDPGIFPTNLDNEFQLLKAAAIQDHKIGVIEAERWIDGLRRLGVKLFTQAHAAKLS